jgi:hypothetical protein
MEGMADRTDLLPVSRYSPLGSRRLQHDNYDLNDVAHRLRLSRNVPQAAVTVEDSEERHECVTATCELPVNHTGQGLRVLLTSYGASRGPVSPLVCCVTGPGSRYFMLSQNARSRAEFEVESQDSLRTRTASASSGATHVPDCVSWVAASCAELHGEGGRAVRSWVRNDTKNVAHSGRSHGRKQYDVVQPDGGVLGRQGRILLWCVRASCLRRTAPGEPRRERDCEGAPGGGQFQPHSSTRPAGKPQFLLERRRWRR